MLALPRHRGDGSKFFFARSTLRHPGAWLQRRRFWPYGPGPKVGGGLYNYNYASVSIGGGSSNCIYAYAAGGVGNSACMLYAYTADGNMTRGLRCRLWRLLGLRGRLPGRRATVGAAPGLQLHRWRPVQPRLLPPLHRRGRPQPLRHLDDGHGRGRRVQSRFRHRSNHQEGPRVRIASPWWQRRRRHLPEGSPRGG